MLDEKDDGGGLCKVKTRFVANGITDPDATEVEAATPAISRDGLWVLLQVLMSKRRRPWFADFKQAFMSGGPLDRGGQHLFCELPPGGIPGLKKGGLVELPKTVHGLTDGLIK